MADEDTAQILGPVMSQVADLLREVSAGLVMPHFRSLAAADVHTKSADEIVTRVDVAVETALRERLPALVASSQVVGEELTGPADMSRLGSAPWTWLVDPVDGTQHFVDGADAFGIMLSLLRGAETVAAWILEPVSGRLSMAAKGRGARVDGQRVSCSRSRELRDARGTLLTRFLPEPLRAHVDAQRGQMTSAASHRCAARRYVDTLLGIEDYALYYRTLPWDHAAGVLLVEEAGGIARRFDGTHYQPTDGGSGLLVASSPQLWHELRDVLLPDLPLAVAIP